jgi:hypothetical protein
MLSSSITILAGLLAVLVITDHCRRIIVQERKGRVPVIDTFDVILFIVSIALLLSIAAEMI